MRGRFRRTKRFLFRRAVGLLAMLARCLPRRAALCAFAAIGTIVRWIDRPAVARSRRHLALALGDAADPSDRDAILREMFRAFGRNLVDLFRLRRLEAPAVTDLVEFEGLEHLERARGCGRGVIALSAHLGNWELLGAALAARGYPIAVVAHDVFDSASNDLLNTWRRGWGVRVYPRKHGLFRPARWLRENGIVGALVDQDTGGASVHREFFGHAARTPVAPFRLARRLGAELVPMWIHLTETGRHRITIRPMLPRFAELDDEAVVDAWIDAWHRELEGAIREHPAQWVWFHRRWKTPAPAESLRICSKESVYLQRFQASTEVRIAR